MTASSPGSSKWTVTIINYSLPAGAVRHCRAGVTTLHYPYCHGSIAVPSELRHPLTPGADPPRLSQPSLTHRSFFPALPRAAALIRRQPAVVYRNTYAPFLPHIVLHHVFERWPTLNHQPRLFPAVATSLFCCPTVLRQTAANSSRTPSSRSQPAAGLPSYLQLAFTAPPLHCTPPSGRHCATAPALQSHHHRTTA